MDQFLRTTWRLKSIYPPLSGAALWVWFKQFRILCLWLKGPYFFIIFPFYFSNVPTKFGPIFTKLFPLVSSKLVKVQKEKKFLLMDDKRKSHSKQFDWFLRYNILDVCSPPSPPSNNAAVEWRGATSATEFLFIQCVFWRKSELYVLNMTLMSLATPDPSDRAAWLICYLGLALPRFQLKTMGPNRQAQAGLAIEPPGVPVAAAAGVSAAATDSNWLSFCSLSGRPFIVTKARLSHCINWIGLKGWRSLLHIAGHVRSLKLSRPRSHCVLKWGFTRTFLVTLYLQKQIRVLKSSNLGSL